MENLLNTLNDLINPRFLLTGVLMFGLYLIAEEIKIKLAKFSEDEYMDTSQDMIVKWVIHNSSFSVNEY